LRISLTPLPRRMNVVTPLRMLSVCSGIGGLDLGVSRAIRTRVVGYCERDSFAASCLLARMEESSLDPAPLWCGDLRDMDPGPFAGEVDLYTGGYPCSPFSHSGSRRGEADERHLWPIIRDHLRVIRPPFAFFENVRGHLSLGFEQVLCDLAADGYDVRWTTLRASEAAGAPHLRERLFFLCCHLGNANGPGLEGRGKSFDEGADERATWPPGPEDDWTDVPAWLLPAIEKHDTTTSPQSVLRRVADGTSESLVGAAQLFRADKLRALGNSVVPAQAEAAFRFLWPF
jgi:site-specific DNA-cytosine methylase